LKITNILFLDMLAELFGNCLKFSVFPVEWKKGNVVWLHKEGKDPLAASAYRPITLLSTLGKLLEKVIAQEINTFLDEKESYCAGNSDSEKVEEPKAQFKP